MKQPEIREQAHTCLQSKNYGYIHLRQLSQKGIPNSKQFLVNQLAQINNLFNPFYWQRLQISIIKPRLMSTKNTLQITLLILSFLLFGSTLTPKIFLVGGNTSQRQTLIYNQLAKLAPGRTPLPNLCDQNWQTTTCPRIAVATSAADNEAAGNQVYSEDDDLGLSYHSLFMLFGMAPKHLTIHRDNFRVDGNISTPQGAANLKLIQQADIIFFNGGDQTRHIRSWLNDDGSESSLLTALRLKAESHLIVLSGSSAGSMIWSRQTYSGGDPFGVLYFKNSIGLAPKNISQAQTGDDSSSDTRNGTDSLQYEHNGAKMSAFGFIDFVVDTHFQARGRLGRLPAAMIQVKVSLGIGIDQKTAVYYNNGTGTVYGYNGVTIADLSNAIIPPSKYFTATGILGSYLTAGDVYDFKTKAVISSKALIQTPKYSDATDSDDILADYQASLLSTRLVDQKPLYNLGSTRAPSDFPADTPKFEIKFYKGQQTKGYFSDNKYTVQQILYDFSYGANHCNLRIE